MEVTWEVEDGYLGKSRPKTTIIPDEEIADCETEDEAMQLVEDYVQSDFDNEICWSFSEFSAIDNIKEMIRKIL